MTYGTASTHLATRVLRRVGLDNSTNYPAASQAILRDFYMDDLLTGANTVQL